MDEYISFPIRGHTSPHALYSGPELSGKTST